MMFHMQLGATLRRLRKERHLTQSDLATVFGITQGLLSMIERGESRPSYELMCRINDWSNGAVEVLAWRSSTTHQGDHGKTQETAAS